MQENAKSSYLIIALQKLMNEEKLSSIKDAKNSNQYFNTIKNNGIELIEVWKPNLTNRGRHLERSLNPTEENIHNTTVYLKRLKREI